MKEQSEKGFIKKYLPVIPIVLLTLLLMILFRYNKENIGKLIQQGKKDLISFYMENLQPIFLSSQITNEDVFNFALYNTIPVNKSNNEILLITEEKNGKKEYQIKNIPYDKHTSNYESFAKYFDLTEDEKNVIDSILNSYKKEISISILMNDKNTLAINPRLGELQKILIADLTYYLMKLKRINFDEMFKNNFLIRDKINLSELISLKRKIPNNEYIFITPDTIFKYTYEIDTSKLKLNGDISIPKFSYKKLKKFNIEINFDNNVKMPERLIIRDDSTKLKINVPINMVNMMSMIDDSFQVKFKDLDVLLKQVEEQISKGLINTKEYGKKGNQKIEFHFRNPIRLFNEFEIMGKQKDWDEFIKDLDSFRENYSDTLVD